MCPRQKVIDFLTFGDGNIEPVRLVGPVPYPNPTNRNPLGLSEEAAALRNSGPVLVTGNILNLLF